MACGLCGGGDACIKTCLTPEGSRILVCDPCHMVHADDLTVVPGDRLVAARCDLCGAYGNPREFSGLRLGGKKGAYSGACAECAGKEDLGGSRAESASSADLHLYQRPQN